MDVLTDLFCLKRASISNGYYNYFNSNSVFIELLIHLRTILQVAYK